MAGSVKDEWGDEMARVDDYANAKKLALEAIKERPIDEIAKATGFENISNNTLRFSFLDQTYSFNPVKGQFQNETTSEREVPLQEQVLILHYIQSARKSIAPIGKYLAYREIDGASFYFGAFAKRAINPLKNVFGSQIDAFIKAATALGATPLDQGDASFAFTLFPKMTIQLILWKKDEEFDSEASILFDGVVSQLFSAEDAAWLASMVVYRLMALMQNT